MCRPWAVKHPFVVGIDGATSVPSVILLRRIAQPATVFRSLHTWQNPVWVCSWASASVAPGCWSGASESALSSTGSAAIRSTGLARVGASFGPCDALVRHTAFLPCECSFLGAATITTRRVITALFASVAIGHGLGSSS